MAEGPRLFMAEMLCDVLTGGRWAFNLWYRIGPGTFVVAPWLHLSGCWLQHTVQQRWPMCVSLRNWGWCQARKCRRLTAVAVIRVEEYLNSWTVTLKVLKVTTLSVSSLKLKTWDGLYQTKVLPKHAASVWIHENQRMRTGEPYPPHSPVLEWV